MYITLGGNKLGVIKKYKNILIVMFWGGLWPGASVNFILWGLCHGFLIIINDILKKEKYILPKPLKQLGVFIFVTLLWILFRSESLEVVKLKFIKIFNFENYFYNFSYDLFNMLIGLLMICFVIIIDFIGERRTKLNGNFRVLLCILYLWLISFIGIFNGTNFIYFKF